MLMMATIGMKTETALIASDTKHTFRLTISMSIETEGGGCNFTYSIGIMFDVLFCRISSVLSFE